MLKKLHLCSPWQPMPISAMLVATCDSSPMRPPATRYIAAESFSDTPRPTRYFIAYAQTTAIVLLNEDTQYYIRVQSQGTTQSSRVIDNGMNYDKQGTSSSVTSSTVTKPLTFARDQLERPAQQKSWMRNRHPVLSVLYISKGVSLCSRPIETHTFYACAAPDDKIA